MTKDEKETKDAEAAADKKFDETLKRMLGVPPKKDKSVKTTK